MFQIHFEEQKAHKLVAGMLVLASCRIMMHTIARDPNLAIFVEMVSTIQRSLLRFLIGYVWLFVGWIVAFYIVLGDDYETDNGLYNSFHDIGSATGKVFAMFTGELGYETAFSYATTFEKEPVYYNIW